jgi:hypothetical protein
MQKWEYVNIVRYRKWKEKPKGGVYHDADRWANSINYPDGSSKKIEADFTVFVNQLGEQGWELFSISPRSSYLGGYLYTHHVAAPDTESSDFAGFTDTEIWVFKRAKP